MKCSTCQAELPTSEFYRNKARRGGLHNVCIACTTAYHRRYVSLDAPAHRGYTQMLGEQLAARKTRTDTTYELVYKALAYWIKERILTRAQAEAIYLCAVESFSFCEVAELVECDRSTVRYHYDVAVSRLRERYADQAEMLYGA